MSFVAQIDSVGHVTLPKEVLGELRPGDLIRVDRLDSSEEPSLLFDEYAAIGGLIDEDGLLVWRSAGPDEQGLDRKVTMAIRRERDLRNGGILAETLD